MVQVLTSLIRLFAATKNSKEQFRWEDDTDGVTAVNLPTAHSRCSTDHQPNKFDDQQQVIVLWNSISIVGIILVIIVVFVGFYACLYRQKDLVRQSKTSKNACKKNNPRFRSNRYKGKPTRKYFQDNSYDTSSLSSSERLDSDECSASYSNDLEEADRKSASRDTTNSIPVNKWTENEWNSHYTLRPQSIK